MSNKKTSGIVRLFLTMMAAVGTIVGGQVILTNVLPDAHADGTGGKATTSATATNSTTTTAPTSAAPADEMVKALTVTLVMPQCSLNERGVIPVRIQSLQDGVKGDGMSPPLPANGTMTEVYKRICADPLYGAQVGNHFANATIAGVRLTNVNPWMSKWDTIDKANATAQSFIPLFGISDPTPEQVATAVKKNSSMKIEDDSWQLEASSLITFLKKYYEGGVRSEASTFNFHMIAGGLQAMVMPKFELNSVQEGLPAYQLTLTTKTGQCLDKVGFNIQDGRLEGFPCGNTPEQPTKSSTATSTPSRSTTTPANTPAPCKIAPGRTSCENTTPSETPTSTPTPSETPTSTPTPSETPTSTPTPTLEPKPSETRSWTVQPSASPASATTTEQTAPPSVPTVAPSELGGGSATQTPHSEVTGLPAPGSTTSSTTTSTTTTSSPPAPAPGANTVTTQGCVIAPGETSC